MVEPLMRDKALSLVESLLHEQVITPQDLASFTKDVGDPFDPEYIRQEMQTWYRTLGIEVVTKSKFTLKRPPFTREELMEAHEQGEIVLCVPQGITLCQLGTLFNLSSWAFQDELVSDTTEVEDFWFKTKSSLLPDDLNKSGVDVKRTLERENKLGMSLHRYMVFVARIRYLMGEHPDIKHWIWLTRGRYDQKSMLIAGLDAHLKFSVHAWLPHFQGKLCGVRYAKIPDHL